MIERDGKLEDAKVSVNMNKNQLEDYLGTLKNELDINYMDLGEYYFHDDKIDENYDTKTEVAKIRNRAVEFKIKKNQKIIRFVAIKQFKNFLANQKENYAWVLLPILLRRKSLNNCCRNTLYIFSATIKLTWHVLFLL